MKTLSGILFIVLHMSCSLLIPQLSNAADRYQAKTELHATDCPEQSGTMPLDHYPGEDQEPESSANVEESGNCIYHAQAFWVVQPIYLQSHDIRYYRDCQLLPTQTADVLAPPPKA
jgi:hypothetical protein